MACSIWPSRWRTVALTTVDETSRRPFAGDGAGASALTSGMAAGAGTSWTTLAGGSGGSVAIGGSGGRSGHSTIVVRFRSSSGSACGLVSGSSAHTHLSLESIIGDALYGTARPLVFMYLYFNLNRRRAVPRYFCHPNRRS